MSWVKPSPPCVLWKTILPFGDDCFRGASCAACFGGSAAARQARVIRARNLTLARRGSVIESSSKSVRGGAVPDYSPQGFTVCAGSGLGALLYARLYDENDAVWR